MLCYAFFLMLNARAYYGGIVLFCCFGWRSIDARAEMEKKARHLTRSFFFSFINSESDLSESDPAANLLVPMGEPPLKQTGTLKHG